MLHVDETSEKCFVKEKEKETEELGNTFITVINSTRYIVLLAIVNVDYKFKMIDIGGCGVNSNGGELEHCAFGRLLYSKELYLPKPKSINSVTNEPLPFIFVADKAFRLSANLMEPYPRRNLDKSKRRYNYHLSRKRQAVECTFGILASKFIIY